VVALDVTTGKLKWHQQLVHHDIWDYDVPAARNRRQTQRQDHARGRGHDQMALVFIFDRVTGEPIFGVEERPVPQAASRAKDLADATVSVKPAPLARHSIRRRTSADPSTRPTANSCGTTTPCERGHAARRGGTY
jgi:quinoprotein glucose dehydrogenase